MNYALWFVLVIVWAFAYEGIKHLYNLRKERILKAQDVRESIEADGHYVQVDCAECGKMNRIAAVNIRRRPICGGCKKKLLPKKRISILRVRNLPFDQRLDAALDSSTIKDYDKFWATLAAHFRDRSFEKNEPINPKDLPN